MLSYNIIKRKVGVCMGTRGIFILKTEDVELGVYIPSDAYPSVSGFDVLKILRNQCNNYDKIIQNAKNVRIISKEDLQKKCYELAGGKQNYEKLDIFKKNSVEDDARWAFNLTYGGYGLLSGLIDDDEEITIEDYIPFAADSLMCEWGYILDFTTNAFEVYKGFNQETLSPVDRFYYMQDNEVYMKDNNPKYKPIKLAASFNLDKLPTEQIFKNKIYEKDNMDDELEETGIICLEKYIDGDKEDEQTFEDENQAQDWIRNEIDDFYQTTHEKLEIYNDSYMVVLINKI